MFESLTLKITCSSSKISDREDDFKGDRVVSVGCSSHRKITLKDDAISKYHGAFYFIKDTLYYEHTGKNPAFFNATPVVKGERIALRKGSLVAFQGKDVNYVISVRKAKLHPN